MFLTSLPKTDKGVVQSLPDAHADHFLLYEQLQQPYYCPEQVCGLGILISGNGTSHYRVNGLHNRLSPQQAYIVNRHTRLSIEVTEKNAAPGLLFFHSRLSDLVHYSLEQSPENLLDNPGAGAPGDFSFLEGFQYRRELYDAITSLIALGSSCSSFAALKADIIIRNLLEKLLIENAKASQLSQQLDAVKAATRIEIYRRVSLAKAWMEANNRLSITLEDMAAIASMNSQHFLRMFRQLYHITPHQHLISIRLGKARQLLTETSMPVGEICNSLGLESIYSFSILFRKRYGLSPSRFRKKNQILHFR